MADLLHIAVAEFDRRSLREVAGEREKGPVSPIGTTRLPAIGDAAVSGLFTKLYAIEDRRQP